MSKKNPFDATSLKSLKPGAWKWREGIGYRRNSSGDGGTWYIKYRAPFAVDANSDTVAPVRQVKERLPNCRNKSQAEGVLMARKAAVFEGTFQRKKKTAPATLKTYAPKFLDAKRHLRSVAKYRQQLEQHLMPYFKSKPLAAISNDDCLAYYNRRLDSDAAISTVNGEIACLKSLFSHAVTTGVVSANPAKSVKLINPNNARDRVLSSEETARLFNTAQETPGFIRPLFGVLYHTGLRLGEAIALEWADVQFDHDRVVIRRSKSGEGRKIPMRAALADELIAWRASSGGGRWVFPSRYDDTKPMCGIRKAWTRLCASAGVDDLRPHDLRHNFTSMLQANGVSDSVIMSITGHKTHVMLHRYSHSQDKDKAAAVAALPRPDQKSRPTIVKMRRS